MMFRRILKVAVALVILFGLLSLDWRSSRPAGLPKVVESGHAVGDLTAGSGQASLVPPFPTPIAGFNDRGNRPYQHVQGTPGVRAVLLMAGGKRIAVVSAELMLIPAPLRVKVLDAVKDLKLDELLLGATHTHSGVGGFWNDPVAQWSGIARYDPKIEKFVVDQIVSAIRAAARDLVPARITTRSSNADGMASNRDGGPVDSRLTSARITSIDGHIIASLVVFAMHPTTIMYDDMTLSGDWPGAMLTHIETDTKAPALFFQGAVGDATWSDRAGKMSGEDRAIKLGDAMAEKASAFPPGALPYWTLTLGWARAEVALPPCDLRAVVGRFFNPIVSNLFCWATHPQSTDVSVLRVGSLLLANVPGELVGSLGIEWRKQLNDATIVSVMDDYVGYIETPARMNEGSGEAKRSYFGPQLAPALLDGLKLARDAALVPQSH